MPTFVFKGRDRMNQVVTGEKDADNREALRMLLRREQIVMTSANEKGREFSIPKLSARRKVGAKELAVFTRQFSVMIDAGLPLVQCLDILSEQQKNQFFKDVLAQVRQNVEEGSTLAASMARHPKVFDNLYSSMVEAGETGGVLDLILQRLATLIEKVVKLKRSIVSALIYPDGGGRGRDRGHSRDHGGRDPAVRADLSRLARPGRAAAVTDPYRYGYQRFCRRLGRPRNLNINNCRRDRDLLLL